MKTTNSKSTGKNGGARPGAGRKPKPDGEKSVTVSLSLSGDLHRQLKDCADSDGISVNDAIREAVACYLKRKKSRKIAKDN